MTIVQILSKGQRKRKNISLIHKLEAASGTEMPFAASIVCKRKVSFRVYFGCIVANCRKKESLLLHLHSKLYNMNETKNVSKRTRNPIFFRKDGGWKSVSTDCIVCMEACAYKCIFYMDDGTVKEVEMPLGTALAKAQEQATTFLRVHRSYAVNIEHIDMVHNDSVIMQNGKRIPIGREYRDSIPRNLVLIDKRDRSALGEGEDINNID